MTNIEPNNASSQDPQEKEIDCQDLVEVLYEYVDGGCDPELRQQLQQHLDDCPSCVEQLGVEQEVRTLLKTRCVESAPTELRTRITSQLHVTYRTSRA